MSPVQPTAQVHIFGEIQAPPLWQPKTHSATEQVAPDQPAGHVQTSGAVHVPWIHGCVHTGVVHCAPFQPGAQAHTLPPVHTPPLAHGGLHAGGLFVLAEMLVDADADVLDSTDPDVTATVGLGDTAEEGAATLADDPLGAEVIADENAVLGCVVIASGVVVVVLMSNVVPGELVLSMTVVSPAGGAVAMLWLALLVLGEGDPRLPPALGEWLPPACVDPDAP